MYYTTYYYSLRDIAIASNFYESPCTPITSILDREKGIRTFLGSVLGFMYVEDLPSKVLWQDYIWPLMYTTCVLRTEENVDDNLVSAAAEVCGRMLWWYNSTAAYYSPLITLYAAEQDNLMKELTNRSVTLYNDTPQDGGDFTGDEHTTTATQVVSNVEHDTKINRLDEIRKKLVNLYAEWCSDFYKNFHITTI